MTTSSAQHRSVQREYIEKKDSVGDKAIRFSFIDQFIVRACRLKSERRFLRQQESKTNDGGGLRKVLSATDLVVIGVGGIVGAGVFVLTGTAAKENAGPALVVSYLIAMCASVLTALCYSEFATCVPTSGSAYNFISITFGEVFAYITGWNLAIELTVGGAAVARGFTSYLATLFGLKPDALRVKIIEHVIELDFCAFLLVSAMTLTIIRGMEQTKNFQFVVVALAMATIAFVIIVGCTEVDVDNYTPFIPPEFGWQGVMAAASVVFFAFIGFDTVATLAEETKNPGKDLPIGILGSLAISGILYCAMAGVITGIDPVPFAEGRGCRGYKKANEASAVAAGKINPWRIEGKIAKDDRSIFIDFDQKDGSGESFTGEWNGAGIVFPDGNQWTKIDDAAAPTSGAQLSSR